MDDIIANALLDSAILAPSGHNSQPWKFRVGEDCITVMPDFSKRLYMVDPLDREIFISIGCAVENICITATKFNLKTLVEIKDNNVDITFERCTDIVASPLVSFIAKRQTNRNIFDNTLIHKSIIDYLSSTGAKLYSRGSKEFDIVKSFVKLGNSAQMTDKDFVNELKEWMRLNETQAARELDGLSYDVIGAPNMPSWISRPIVSLMLNAAMQNRSDMKKLQSSPFIAAFDGQDDMAGWIETGRRLERFLLIATSHNIACAFINQPCEVESLAVELGRQLHLQQKLQILLRIGHASPSKRSRRRPREAFIVDDM